MADTVNPDAVTPESTVALPTASIQSDSATAGVQSVATGDAVAPATTTAGTTEVVGAGKTAGTEPAPEPTIDPLDPEQMGQAVLKDIGIDSPAEAQPSAATEVVQNLGRRIDGLARAFMDTRQELAAVRRDLAEKEADPFVEPGAEPRETAREPARETATREPATRDSHLLEEVNALRNEMEWNEIVRRHPLLAGEVAPKLPFKQVVAALHRGTPGISVSQAAEMTLRFYATAAKRGSAASVARIKGIVETGKAASVSRAKPTVAVGARAVAPPASPVSASSEHQATYDKALVIVEEVLQGQSAKGG